MSEHAFFIWLITIGIVLETLKWVVILGIPFLFGLFIARMFKDQV